MKSERAKMLAGELYDPRDAELESLRASAASICRELNTLAESDTLARLALLRRLVGQVDASTSIRSPFHCDYGFNLILGKQVYFNFNCVVLDVCPVTIGDHTLIGPAVQIYTATHPIDRVERRSLEFGRPVTIGSDVWIGGGAIVCPGVTIGSGTVIGAGSIVTRDVPEGVVAVGNPCRVIRSL